MQYDPEKHRRRSIRLQEYDYSQPGAYFVTICVRNGECLFGEISKGKVHYSQIGIIADDNLVKTMDGKRLTKLDSYVIMPNHVHIIVFIESDERYSEGVSPKTGPRSGRQASNTPTDTKPLSYDRRGVTCNARENADYYSEISPRNNSLPVLVRNYKAAVTQWCNKNGREYFKWQRNYYEHVIRNEIDLHQTREYIINNPIQWEFDEENPQN